MLSDNPLSGMRICKALSHLGICSRREAEKLVGDNRVIVNDKKIDSPIFFVKDGDHIKISSTNHKVIITKKSLQSIKLFKYYKPKNVIVSTNDEKSRTTIFQLLPSNLGRLVTVGRLDYNTEGLILLTNNGTLSREFELPSSKYLRKYLCKSYGSIPHYMISELSKGITQKGVSYRPIEMKIVKNKGQHYWSEIILQEGKNREIRKIFNHYGLQVSRLIRTSYGPYHLKDMTTGEIRKITYTR